MTETVKLYQQGTGPALTLIHGWGMNAAVFQPWAEQLAMQFSVTRVDLPGYGQSLWQPDAGFDAQVDALAGVLPDSTLIGWSMGGLYAQRLAACYPEKFSKLVLLSSNPCFVQRDDWPCAVKAQVFKEFAASLDAGWQATIRRFLGLQMRGSDQARQLIKEVSRLLIAGGEPQSQALQFGLDLLLDRDGRQELAGLQIPVLSILGQRDTLVPECVGEQIHRINPLIRVECLARSAHAPFLSHSEPVTSLISEFVKPSASR